MKALEIISRSDWTLQATLHEERVSPYGDAFIRRRSAGMKHPVHDFLFTYYNLSPSKLRQWLPRFDQALEMTPELRETYPWLNDYWFHFEDNLLSFHKERIQENHLGISRFVGQLCKNLLNRTPRYGCFGLHEWAMVYKISPEEIRHKTYPLRLSQEDISAFVQSQKLCCTHYDAYRFFTPSALPLNSFEPTIASRLEMEQPGCVHANMDLYKWSIKLWPWIGSELLTKSFFLALEARELDMKASPYDLMNDGYPPICIETEEGRKEYQKQQQLLAEKAAIIRMELLEFCQKFSP